MLPRVFGQGKGGNVTINTTDNVSFTQGSSINVRGEEKGSINISAKNLSLMSDSDFIAGIDIDSGFADAQSGDIVINLTEDLVLDGLDSESLSSINNSNLGKGNAGNINIKARNIILRNGGQISSNISGKGNIGNINLTATDIIRVDGFGKFVSEDGTKSIALSSIFSEVNDSGIGNSGTIAINTKKLHLSRNGVIQTAMVGRGNAGNIIIDATDAVFLDGTEDFQRDEQFLGITTGIFSGVLSEGVGNGGNINITTKKFFLNNEAQIGSIINGRGNGGIINIDAVESISLDGLNQLELPTAISTRVQEGGIGNSGQIILNTRNLTVANGAGIDSSTFGTGNAGSVTINATDAVSLDGEGRNDLNSGISSSVEMVAVGKGGEIEVNATNLFLTNGAQILSATFGEGKAGSVTINVVDTVSLDGEDKDGFPSAITSGVDVGAVGNGGKVVINAKRLLLTDGAVVSSNTGSKGNAGSVTIRASESVELNGTSEGNRSGLFVNAVQGSGNGGDLDIFTDKLIIRDGAIKSAGSTTS